MNRLKQVSFACMLFVFSNLAYGQYIAKIVNGQIANSNIFQTTSYIRVSSDDMLVRGVQNFTAKGQFARYFIGDTNHAIGAVYGSGVFFKTYQNPYAMVIQDTTGNVGIATTTPTALLEIGGCPGVNTHCNMFLAGGFHIDYAGNAHVSSELDIDGAVIAASGANGDNITMSGSGISAQGITSTGGITSLTVTNKGIIFPDGTVQTTACKP